MTTNTCPTCRSTHAPGVTHASCAQGADRGEGGLTPYEADPSKESPTEHSQQAARHLAFLEDCIREAKSPEGISEARSQAVLQMSNMFREPLDDASAQAWANMPDTFRERFTEVMVLLEKTSGEQFDKPFDEAVLANVEVWLERRQAARSL
jgi:hypothetical protein